MNVLGIESSCDECSCAVVRDGKTIVGHVIASQIELHKPYEGVVPELASRKHLEWIRSVYRQTISEADLKAADIDGIAVTSRPGLSGSLQVGFSFAKALAWGLDLPWISIDHIKAHLYAPQLIDDIPYPHIGLLVSGGHSIICRVDGFDDITVLGASIDDAVGEAFDKVAKHYGLGYPGGKRIDDLARTGNAHAFNFPHANLYKGQHTYDLSYSGLKNAVVNQINTFWDGSSEQSIQNIAASFERVAIDMVVKRTLKASRDLGINRIVAGGGVAANSYLRSCFASEKDTVVYFPPLELCADNAAMIAGIGYHLLQRGDRSEFSENISPRVAGFRKAYP